MEIEFFSRSVETASRIRQKKKNKSFDEGKSELVQHYSEATFLQVAVF